MQPTQITLNWCHHQTSRGERLMFATNNRPSRDPKNNYPNPIPSPRSLYVKNQDIHNAHKQIAFHNLVTKQQAAEPNRRIYLFAQAWFAMVIRKDGELEPGRKKISASSSNGSDTCCRWFLAGRRASRNGQRLSRLGQLHSQSRPKTSRANRSAMARGRIGILIGCLRPSRPLVHLRGAA